MHKYEEKNYSGFFVNDHFEGIGTCVVFWPLDALVAEGSVISFSGFYSLNVEHLFIHSRHSHTSSSLLRRHDILLYHRARDELRYCMTIVVRDLLFHMPFLRWIHIPYYACHLGDGSARSW